MRALRGLRMRLRALLRRGAVERELSEEIRLHLDLQTEQNVARGMNPAEARRAALASFGGVEAAREYHRDERGVRWLQDLAADMRYAVRALRRNPVLSGAAVLTLALGVGANTAIFSAVNAVLLRPLPFHDPGRLVALGENHAERGWHMQVAAPANMLDWREQVDAFADVAGYADWGALTVTLTGEGPPRPLRGAMVTGNFFAVLGVRAERGRTLRDDESWSAGDSVPRPVVISHRLWQDQFGGRDDVLGRLVRFDGTPFAIVGVMPAWFAYPYERGDFWFGTSWPPEARSRVSFRRAHWIRPIARLKPGVGLPAADAELQAVVRRLEQQYPETNRLMGASLVPLHDFRVGDTRRPLLLLLGAVVLLLLIACANVGNLLVVQAAGREREAALRLTLGAGRGRLVRQALTESVVLSLVGGAAGLALGWWGTGMLAALQPPGMMPVRDVRMDWTVLGYVLGIATLSGLLFGTAPALWNARRAPAEVLKNDGGRSGVGRHARRWSDALAVTEVAIAVLLTIGAGLLVRSFVRLNQVDPGFDGRGVLAVRLEVPRAYSADRGRLVGFYRDLTARAATVPGVVAAAVAARPPLTQVNWTSDFTIRGDGATSYGAEAAHREISPDYFRVMGTRLLGGRVFTSADVADAQPVVIINDVLAAAHFRGADPIGTLICFDAHPDSTTVWRTIVGVVSGERQASLATEPMMEVYEPSTQSPRADMYLLLRTDGDPSALAPAVRRLVTDAEPDLAIQELRTMDAIRADSMARQRFVMVMLLAFAVTGLVLAVVGVYGVMAQLARRRTREMGIRVALGARAGAVQWLVVRHALTLVGVALAVGIAAAVAAGRAIRALLFQTPPTDPLTFVSVPLILAVTAMLASWLPALRASRSDPAQALRAE